MSIKKKGAFYGKTISCVSDDEDDYYSNVCTPQALRIHDKNVCSTDERNSSSGDWPLPPTHPDSRTDGLGAVNI